MVQHIQPFLAIPPVAVHLAVDVLVVQLRRSSLCCRSDKFQLLVLTAGMRGWLFWALAHRYRAGSRVHRDTAPILRCIYWRLLTETFFKSSVRTTTTTSKRFHPSVAPLCETSAVDVGRRTRCRRRHRKCPPPEGATPPFHVAA